ncbi:MAG TPA: hypothetical protein VEK84_14000 [Terriglobales bacterium]|nr:hypothetical protein [Terriglobales bacterium]
MSISLHQSRIWKSMIWMTKPKKSTGLENPVLGAAELLRFSRVQQVLQP